LANNLSTLAANRTPAVEKGKITEQTEINDDKTFGYEVFGTETVLSDGDEQEPSTRFRPEI
jgi:hypothetical protein